jgi:hypothetical protein
MTNQPTYDIIRKYVREYARGMGKSKEIEMTNLTWEQANQYKDDLNMYHLDETTDYYYINQSQN